jgi:putative hydroxymethylpyrimidine transport system substrate-binding protein
MNLRRSLLALLAVASLLFGCGDGGEGSSTESSAPFQSLRLNLESEPSPENVGPVMALKNRDFYELGLGVWINTPIHPDRPIKYVNTKLVEAAVAHEPELVLTAAAGLPVVAFGSLIPEPTMAMIWLPDSGIESIADLEGKTIAYPGVPFQKAFLEFVLAEAGLTLADVKLENVGHDLAPALVQGRADAIFGGSPSVEGAVLEARGLEPVITPVSELGIPAYDELVLVVRRDKFAANPDLYRRLLEASVRGNAAAAEDPKVAAEAIVDQSFGVAPAKASEAGVEAVAPLLSETGEIDAEQLEGLIAWMHAEGMIEREPSVSELLAPP